MFSRLIRCDKFTYIAHKITCSINLLIGVSLANRDRDLTDLERDREREMRQAEIGEARPLCDDYLDHDEDLLDEDSMEDVCNSHLLLTLASSLSY